MRTQAETCCNVLDSASLTARSASEVKSRKDDTHDSVPFELHVCDAISVVQAECVQDMEARLQALGVPSRKEFVHENGQCIVQLFFHDPGALASLRVCEVLLCDAV